MEGARRAMAGSRRPMSWWRWGAWSDTVTRAHGLKLPLGVKRGYHMHYRPEGNATLSRPVHRYLDRLRDEPDDARHPRDDGAEFATATRRRIRCRSTRRAVGARGVPDGRAGRSRAVAGAPPVSPGHAASDRRGCGKKGLWMNFGHHHLGFTLGPVTARLLAEVMTGEAPFTIKSLSRRAVLSRARRSAAEPVPPRRDRAVKRQRRRFVDAAGDGAREAIAGRHADLGDVGSGSVSGFFCVATAKTVSPSIGAWAGRTARARPSSAMIARRLACGLVKIASVATRPMVVAGWRPPFMRSARSDGVRCAGIRARRIRGRPRRRRPEVRAVTDRRRADRIDHRDRRDTEAAGGDHAG